MMDDSKRYGSIEKQDQDLTSNQSTLEHGTKMRNREFHEHLQAIHEKIVVVEHRLAVAEKERELAAAQLRARLDQQFKEVKAIYQVKVEQDFDIFVKEAVPPAVQRVVEVEDDVKHYVNSTVPAAVEKQSGEVMRKMKKAHESFDIENAKIRKREAKIMARFEEHMIRTAQSFEDETSTRIGKLRLLEEDVRERDVEFDREEEREQNDIKVQLRGVRDTIALEERQREEEDCTMLDSMLEAQKELQRIILENFGIGGLPDSNGGSYK